MEDNPASEVISNPLTYSESLEIPLPEHQDSPADTNPDETFLEIPLPCADDSDTPARTDTPPKTPVLGVQQAKKRLQAFSLMKQSKMQESPLKKKVLPKVVVKTEEVYDENGTKLEEKVVVKKPAKRSDDKKGRSVIEEIEEIKREETAFLEALESGLLNSKERFRRIGRKDDFRKARNRRRYRRRTRSRSPSPKNLVYPSDWTQVKCKEMDLSELYSLRLKIMGEFKNSAVDFRKQLCFERNSHLLNSLETKGSNGVKRIVPPQFVRFSKSSPMVSYSENYQKNKTVHVPRKEIVNFMPKTFQEHFNKIINCSHPRYKYEKKSAGKSRKWYEKTMLNDVNNETECEILESSLGLSFLQNYSELEEDEANDSKTAIEEENSKIDEWTEKSEVAEKERKSSKDKKSKKAKKDKSKKKDGSSERKKTRASSSEDRNRPEQPKQKPKKNRSQSTDKEIHKPKQHDRKSQSSERKKPETKEPKPQKSSSPHKPKPKDTKHPKPPITTEPHSTSTPKASTKPKPGSTPDTDEYHSLWESDDEAALEPETVAREKRKLNRSWESDEEVFERGKVSQRRRASAEKRRSSEAPLSLEMPLNIKLFQREKEKVSPVRTNVFSLSPLYNLDGWGKEAVRQLEEERKTLDEQRRLLDIEKQKLEEMERERELRRMEVGETRRKYERKRRDEKDEFKIARKSRWDHDDESRKSKDSDVGKSKEKKLENMELKNKKKDDDKTGEAENVPVPEVKKLENEYEEFIKAVSNEVLTVEEPKVGKRKKRRSTSSSSSSSSSSSDDSDSSDSKSSSSSSSSDSDTTNKKIQIKRRKLKDEAVIEPNLFDLSLPSKKQFEPNLILPVSSPVPLPVPTPKLSETPPAVVPDEPTKPLFTFNAISLPTRKTVLLNNSLNLDDDSNSPKADEPPPPALEPPKPTPEEKDVKKPEETTKEVVKKQRSPRRRTTDRRRTPERRRRRTRSRSSSPRRRRESPRRRPSPGRRRTSPFRKLSPRPRRSRHLRSPPRRHRRSPTPPRRPLYSPDHRKPSGAASTPVGGGKSPLHSPLDGFKRSLADSTISDDVLLQRNSLDATGGYGASPGTASPKRVPLDVRINQVLGIETEETKLPETNVLPPNYVAMMPHGFYGQMPYAEMYKPNYMQFHQPPPNFEQPQQQQQHMTKVVQIGNMLQIVPTEEQPPIIPQVTNDHSQKILQVGNILQIVPSEFDVKPVDIAVQESAAAVEGGVAEMSSVDEAIKQKLAERRAAKEKRRLEKERKRKEKEAKKKEKEQKKQIRLQMKTERMIKQALMLETGEGEGHEDEGADDFIDSTVPIIVSSDDLEKPPGKGILISKGFSKISLGGDEKRKSVKFADGVCPGDGTSTSGGEELSSPPPKKLPKEKRYKKTKMTRKIKKKKVKVKVVRKTAPEDEGNEDDDEDVLPPPPPPPGSPPPHIFPPRIKTHTVNNLHQGVNVAAVPGGAIFQPQQALYRMPVAIGSVAPPPAAHHAGGPLFVHPPPPPHHPPPPPARQF